MHSIPCPVEITEAARERALGAVMESGPDSVLRIAVKGGGCAGFTYGFEIDRTIADDDLVHDFDGVRIAIDAFSAPLLEGATIDFKDELFERSFVVRNPKVASTCGCGSSFALA